MLLLLNIFITNASNNGPGLNFWLTNDATSFIHHWNWTDESVSIIYNQTDGIPLSYNTSFPPIEAGLLFNGTNFLVLTISIPPQNSLTNFDRTGTIVAQYNLSSRIGTNLFTGGITTNGTDYWISAATSASFALSNSYIFHLNSTFENQTDMIELNPAGANNARGLYTNGSDFWVLDAEDFHIYHLNRTGNNITDGLKLPSTYDFSVAAMYGNNSDFWIVSAEFRIC